MQNDPKEAEHTVNLPGNWSKYLWAWVTTPEARKPVTDYSSATTVAVIGILAIVTTFTMAYGFNKYGFRPEFTAGLHWLKVICLVVSAIGFQVLREKAIKERTDTAEQNLKRIQDDYYQKQAEIAEKQTELNKLTWALSERQKELTENQSDLIQSQRELVKIIKTMPPAHALSTFTESFRYTLFQYRYRQRIDENSTEVDVENAIAYLQQTIRFSLNAVAQLFLHYEHKPLDTKCSAHLALFIDKADILGDPERNIEKNEQLAERVRKGIRFVDDRKDPLRGLDGVLHVDPALSACAEPRMDPKRVSAPDPKLVNEVFLPIPNCDNEHPDSPRSRSIPIAPRAFRFGQVIYDNVATKITRDASKNWNVTQDVIDEVESYFQGTEHGPIGSAVGYRLLWEVQGEEGERADPSKFPKLGVLTIFTATPANIDESVLNAYWELVRPILELQKQMILAIVDMRD